VYLKKKPLKPNEARVIIHKGTEAPHTGKFNNHRVAGVYICKQCDNKLYVSDLYQLTEWLALFGKLEYYSKQWYEDDDTGWQELDGFVTFDFKVIGNVSDTFTLEAGVNNMFDENYFLASGYPRPGRTFFGMLKVTL